MMPSRSSFVLLGLLAGLAGCGQILGLGDFTDETGGDATGSGGGATTATTTASTSSVGGGGASSSSSTTGGGGQGGSGTECDAGDQQTCIYTGPNGTEDVGVCKAGYRTCDIDGNWGPCQFEVLPSPSEDCANNLDDDCNGSVNDLCPCTPNDTATCYSGPAGTEGVGLCVGGTQVCNSDGLGYGPCTGEIGPATEDCDVGKLDEDCDGMSNESGTSCVCSPGTSQTCYDEVGGTGGVGICGFGTQICDPTGLAYGACTGDVPPMTEDCTLAGDEDCDGFSCSQTSWAKFYPVNGVTALAGDAAGNVIFAGNFSNTVDFGLGNFIPGSSSEGFLVKTDPAGNALWQKKIGSSGGGQTASLAVGPNGEVYAAGYYAGSGGDLGCGALSATSSISDYNAFAAKFDPNGVCQWSITFGDTAYQTVSRIVVAPGGGSVVIGGSFAGSIVLGGTSYAAVGTSDAFVARLSAATGAVQFGWATAITGHQTFTGLAIDASGNYVFSGYSDQMSYKLTAAGSTLTGPGGWFARHTSADQTSWHNSFSGTSSAATDVGMTTTGYAVVSGDVISGSATIAGQVVTASGGSNVWTAAFSTVGTPFFLNNFGTGNDVRGSRMVVDPQDRMFLAGNFTNSFSMGGANLTSQSAFDPFLGSLKVTTGNPVTTAYRWSRSFPGPSQENTSALGLAASGHVLQAVGIISTIDMGLGVIGTGNGYVVAKIAP